MGMNVNVTGKDSEAGSIGEGNVGVTSNRLHVNPLGGTGKESHNREFQTVNNPSSPVVAGDLHTGTWPAADDIREITVTVAAGLATTISDPGDGIYICFGAPNDNTAITWLSEQTAGVDATTDSYRFFVPVGIPRTFRFTDAVERVDLFKNPGGLGDDDLDVILEAS